MIPFLQINQIGKKQGHEQECRHPIQAKNDLFGKSRNGSGSIREKSGIRSSVEVIWHGMAKSSF